MPLLWHLGCWTCNFPEQALLGAEAQSGLKVLENDLTACSHSVFLRGSQSRHRRQQSQQVALGVSPGPQPSWPPLCSWAIMVSWKNNRVSKIELCKEWKEHTHSQRQNGQWPETPSRWPVFLGRFYAIKSLERSSPWEAPSWPGGWQNSTGIHSSGSGQWPPSFLT